MTARSLTIALVATALCAASVTATAQTVPPSVAVVAHAFGIADGMFSPEQEQDIVGIAYQSAVARTCRGFEIDLEAYQGAVNALASTPDELSAEETTFRDRIIMTVLGMATGGFIADFAANPGEFCEEADTFRSDFAGKTFFTN